MIALDRIPAGSWLGACSHGALGGATASNNAQHRKADSCDIGTSGAVSAGQLQKKATTEDAARFREETSCEAS